MHIKFTCFLKGLTLWTLQKKIVARSNNLLTFTECTKCFVVFNIHYNSICKVVNIYPSASTLFKSYEMDGSRWNDSCVNDNQDSCMIIELVAWGLKCCALTIQKLYPLDFGKCECISVRFSRTSSLWSNKSDILEFSEEMWVYQESRNLWITVTLMWIEHSICPPHEM